LREGHAEELVKTGEGSYPVVSPVSLDALVETSARKEVQELGENESSFVHTLTPSEERGSMSQSSIEIDSTLVLP
jgi:hypothetical protein